MKRFSNLTSLKIKIIDPLNLETTLLLQDYLVLLTEIKLEFPSVEDAREVYTSLFRYLSKGGMKKVTVR